MRDLALVFIVISFFFGTLGADGLIVFYSSLPIAGRFHFHQISKRVLYGLDGRHCHIQLEVT